MLTCWKQFMTPTKHKDLPSLSLSQADCSVTKQPKKSVLEYRKLILIFQPSTLMLTYMIWLSVQVRASVMLINCSYSMLLYYIFIYTLSFYLPALHPWFFFFSYDQAGVLYWTLTNFGNIILEFSAWMTVAVLFIKHFSTSLNVRAMHHNTKFNGIFNI